MSITLDRLRDFEPTRPDSGQISVAVARHAAPIHPSQEVDDYAAERSAVLHGLATDLKLPVVSWGGTDDKYSHEVVEIIMEVVKAVISVFVPALLAVISRKSKGKEQPSVEGAKITNSLGEKLEITCEGRKGNKCFDKQTIELVRAFMSRSAKDDE